jgi:hypothetical protein
MYQKGFKSEVDTPITGVSAKEPLLCRGKADTLLILISCSIKEKKTPKIGKIPECDNGSLIIKLYCFSNSIFYIGFKSN